MPASMTVMDNPTLTRIQRLPSQLLCCPERAVAGTKRGVLLLGHQPPGPAEGSHFHCLELFKGTVPGGPSNTLLWGIKKLTFIH